MSHHTKEPSLLEAFLPIIVLIGLLTVSVWLELAAGNQIGLIMATIVAGLIGYRLNFKWKEMLDGMTEAINTALPAMMILLLIGALAGTWLISGIVPTLIYYGLKILNPTYFLFAACIISAIISLATGSSWSTIATVGVAMFGIGQALGIPAGLTAGSIISGAYFGDKMSPMSDTTNLAPAVAGTDLITHIRYMLWTTIPSISITLIIYFVIGLFFKDEASTSDIEQILHTLDSNFYISPILFIVPAIVIFMIIKKIDAIPAILTGAILGGVFAVIFQPELILTLGAITKDTSFIEASYRAVVDAMTIKTSIVTNNVLVNELLTSKGMEGMLNTIWLIICAMSFGGIMDKLGLLKRITNALISKKKTSQGSLIMTTTLTCIGFNVTTSDQYLAIVVPGKMFSKAYKERGLAPENLSRTLEDSGTVTSVLIPWNTCGMAQSSVLGIATGEYFMYSFFNIISPIMTVTYGYLGIKIKKLKKQ